MRTQFRQRAFVLKEWVVHFLYTQYKSLSKCIRTNRSKNNSMVIRVQMTFSPQKTHKIFYSFVFFLSKRATFQIGSVSAFNSCSDWQELCAWILCVSLQVVKICHLFHAQIVLQPRWRPLRKMLGHRCQQGELSKQFYSTTNVNLWR